MATVGIHSGALGDVILFGRLLSLLPGPRTLIAGGEKARLLAGLGLVDRAVDFESLPMHALFQSAGEHDARLADAIGRADRVVSCFGYGNAGVERRLAEICPGARVELLPVRPSDAAADRHLLAIWAEQVGISLPDSWEGCHAPLAWREEARHLAADLGLAGKAWAVLAPGAGSPEKCWPADRFAELADWFAERGIHSVVLLGPVERDRNGANHAELASLPAVISPPLETLAGLLSEAVCVVGNDSGPAHLAGVVGAPTMVLFGPTQASAFSPSGPQVRVVSGIGMENIAINAVIGHFAGWV